MQPTGDGSTRRYTRAIMRGRHPRSFPHTSQHLWRYIHRSSSRMKLVESGQRLWKAVERHKVRELGADLGRSHSFRKRALGAWAGGGRSPSACEAPSLREDFSGGGAWVPLSRVPKGEGKAASSSSAFSPRDAASPPESRQAPADERQRRARWHEFSSACRREAAEESAGERGAHAAEKKPKTHQRFRESGQQRSDPRVHFGLDVALLQPAADHVGGTAFLSVRDDGNVVAVHEESYSASDIQLFRVLDFSGLTAFRPLRFGDPLWLEVQPGPMGKTWRSGSVLGARLHQAIDMDVISSRADKQEDAADETAVAKPASLGYPQPIRACIPRLEDKMHSPTSLARANESAAFVGKWIVCSPTKEFNRLRREVHDGDLVYLEQDFVFLSSDGPRRCQLRPFGSGEDELHPAVDRRGLWVIRICSSTEYSGRKRISRGERVMNRATQNLKTSSRRRAGGRPRRGKYGEPQIASGAEFSRSIREYLTETATRSETLDLRSHAAKERDPHNYYMRHFERTGPDDEAARNSFVAKLRNPQAALCGSPASSWSYFPRSDDGSVDQDSVANDEDLEEDDEQSASAASLASQERLVRATHRHLASVCMRKSLEAMSQQLTSEPPVGGARKEGDNAFEWNDAPPSPDSHTNDVVSYWSNRSAESRFVDLLDEESSKLAQHVRYRQKHMQMKNLARLYKLDFPDQRSNLKKTIGKMRRHRKAVVIPQKADTASRPPDTAEGADEDDHENDGDESESQKDSGGEKGVGHLLFLKKSSSLYHTTNSMRALKSARNYVEKDQETRNSDLAAKLPDLAPLRSTKLAKRVTSSTFSQRKRTSAMLKPRRALIDAAGVDKATFDISGALDAFNNSSRLLLEVAMSWCTLMLSRLLPALETCLAMSRLEEILRHGKMLEQFAEILCCERLYNAACEMNCHLELQTASRTDETTVLVDGVVSEVHRTMRSIAQVFDANFPNLKEWMKISSLLPRKASEVDVKLKEEVAEAGSAN